MIRDHYIDIHSITDDKNVLKIFKIIREYGGVARFVGGAVRNALAGQKVTNLDLSTDLSPDELAEACEDAGIQTIPIGLKLDTLGVIIGHKLLIISSLNENLCINGHNNIEFTDNWEKDASKRDLTINAVYADDEGNVFDYYNGIDDLEKGIIRFIGDPQQKIREDYIRIFRFFRFYSLFGKKNIDKKSLMACKNNIDGLKNIPIETIRDEFFKILLTPNAAKTLKIMFENNILNIFSFASPHLKELHKLILLEQKHNFNPEVVRRLFVLFQPNKNLAKHIAAKLKLTNKQKEKLTLLTQNTYNFKNLSQNLIQKKALYCHGKDFCLNCLIIEEAFKKDCNPLLENLISSVRKIKIPVFPINGKDIISMGVGNNAHIGLILQKLEKIWINSNFSMTYHQLLKEAQKLKQLIKNL